MSVTKEEKINYSQKLKIMKKVSGIHLTEQHLQQLYEIYNETIDTRESKEIVDLYIEDNKIIICMDLVREGLLTDVIHTNKWSDFKINSNTIQLIEKIKDEENKSRRTKVLDRTTTFKNLISIIIALAALIVSIIALVKNQQYDNTTTTSMMDRDDFGRSSKNL